VRNRFTLHGGVSSFSLGMHRRVLVVEDDEAIRQTLTDVLQDGGYVVDGAVDGAEAIEQMQRRRPDLVLLDLHMPGMDGWEFLAIKAARAGLADVPVLVLSATSERGLGNAQQQGAPIFVRKPFAVDELLASVDRLMTEPPRQCAWCGQVKDDSGAFSLPSGRKLRWASHGICPACKAEEEAELAY
jgi:CheY-like chemotaxis protein